MKTIEKRQARAALIAEARAILDKADTEKRENTADEITAYDGKLAEAVRMLAAIEREEAQFKLDAENAKPLNNQTRSVEVIDNAPKREKGQGFTDCVRAIGVGGRDRRVAADFAETTLHNPELARALSAGNAAGGGFAVPTVLAQEFIEFLRPASVVRAADPRILPMPGGNLTLPAITGGAAATYIGENTNIGATQQVFGQVKLIAKKLAALVPISNDLMRYANPQTDAVIRQDLVLAVAQTEDLAFLRGVGTAFTPKGMKNWALNSFAGTNSPAIPSITTDLGTCISYLLTANVKLTLATGVWFFSPRTMVYLKTLRNPTSGQYAFPEMQSANPTLLGYKVMFTSQIPTNLGSGAQSEAYFANMSDCIIGESANLLLDVSTEATYVDVNGVNISAYAQDQTVIRVIEEHDFAVRYPAAVVVMTGVNY